MGEVGAVGGGAGRKGCVHPCRPTFRGPTGGSRFQG